MSITLLYKIFKNDSFQPVSFINLDGIYSTFATLKARSQENDQQIKFDIS